jgi:ATP-dependent 26S proteasome regulatory subunit
LIIDEKPDVDYADIGGLDLQKQEIREAVELPLTHFGKLLQINKNVALVFLSFKNCTN